MPWAAYGVVTNRVPGCPGRRYSVDVPSKAHRLRVDREAMEFNVLGPLDVRRGGAAIHLTGARQRALLAMMLVHAGQVVLIDRLAHAWWGDHPPTQPKNAIQTSVARLRAALGPELPLVTRGPGYLLDVDDDQVDAHRFDQLLKQARRSDDPVTTVRLLDDALALWRGPPYAEFADGFAHVEALRLEEQRLIAVEERAAAKLALGDSADVVGELQAVVDSEPLRERALSLLMQTLVLEDRRLDALAVYRDYRARLVGETGLEPLPVVADLQLRILRGEDGAVIGRSQTARVSPGGRSVGAPAASNPLVGRDREVAQTCALLEQSRLVTITGTGGVGKTRVAAEIATALREDQELESAWVDLAPVADPDAVAHAVVATTGVDAAGGQPLRDALIGALRPASLLLVLDNCEHLLVGVASLAEQLHRSCPGLRILATSRERLAVEGEHVLPLAPLAVAAWSATQPPAVRLFLDRARAVMPTADLSGQLDEITEICRQLDGLPLAIELAAARAGAMPLEELVAALRLGTPDAVGSRRGIDPRHRDLRAVVNWSYQLLDPSEQQLFEQLSVFAGSFTATEAHAICTTEDLSASETATRLAILAERSILVRPSLDSAEYRMLHTLRRFASERLADRGETETTAERHATAFTEQAERASDARPAISEGGHSWLEARLDDLREAHRWARTTRRVDLVARLSAALYRFAYWRLNAEVMDWAAQALTLSELDEHPAAPPLYASAAVAAWMRGDLDSADHLARRGTQLGAGPDDPTRTYAYETLGDVATFQGRLADAERAYREQVRLAQRTGDIDSQVMGLSSVAFTVAYRGADEAVTTADHAAVLAEGASSPARAFARYIQSECLAESDPDRALELVDEAVEVARSAGATFIEGVARVAAASLRSRHRETQQTLSDFADLLRHWRRTGNWTQQWTTLRNLAEALIRLKVDRPAVAILAAAATSDTAARPYGREAARLEEAQAIAHRRLGHEVYDAAWERGTGMSGPQVVGSALATIDGEEGFLPRHE